MCLPALRISGRHRRHRRTNQSLPCRAMRIPSCSTPQAWRSRRIHLHTNTCGHILGNENKAGGHAGERQEAKVASNFVSYTRAVKRLKTATGNVNFVDKRMNELILGISS